MSPNTPSPVPRNLNPSILDEILVGHSDYSYTFYLTKKKDPIGKGDNQQMVIEGKVIEKGKDWVRVRESSGYKSHTDYLLPLASILYFSENFRGEG